MSSELPSQWSRVRAAVVDDLPEVSAIAGGAVQELRLALRDATAPLTDVLAGRGEVVVDRYSLPAALRCPASSRRSPFAWTPRFAARSLGVRAAERVLQTRQAPNEAVVAVIDEVIAEARDLGQWLDAQAVALRAATVAAAATWAARALVAVPWAALGSVRFDLRHWHRPHGYGSPVVLAARADGVVAHRGARALERVLVALAPPNPVVARLDLLVFTLETGRAPLRHVAVDPASGDVATLDVDRDVLDLAIGEAVEAAGALAPVAVGEEGSTLPGSHCWWCDRRDDCHDGTTWMSTRVARVGGIERPVGSLSD